MSYLTYQPTVLCFISSYTLNVGCSLLVRCCIFWWGVVSFGQVLYLLMRCCIFWWGVVSFGEMLYLLVRCCIFLLREVKIYYRSWHEKSHNKTKKHRLVPKPDDTELTTVFCFHSSHFFLLTEKIIKCYFMSNWKFAVRIFIYCGSREWNVCS
jgi:hypothetical protein